MFWTSDDLDPIGNAVLTIFGPQGRYSDVNSTLYNIKLRSVKYGDLWYGDMDSMDDIAHKCAQLKKLCTELSSDILLVVNTSLDDREIGMF